MPGASIAGKLLYRLIGKRPRNPQLFHTADVTCNVKVGCALMDRTYIRFFQICPYFCVKQGLLKNSLRGFAPMEFILRDQKSTLTTDGFVCRWKFTLHAWCNLFCELCGRKSLNTTCPDYRERSQSV